MAESADLTPKKTASDREFEICRCCAKNISNKSYEKIFFFGIKSETDNIIDLIKKFGEIEILDGDGLPKYTCRTCWLNVKICTLKRMILKGYVRNQKKNLDSKNDLNDAGKKGSLTMPIHSYLRKRAVQGYLSMNNLLMNHTW